MPDGRPERLRAMFERWARGDFGPAPDVFAPDVEWHQLREAVEPGVRRGLDEVGRLTRTIFEIYRDYRVELLELVENGDRTLVAGRARPPEGS